MKVSCAIFAAAVLGMLLAAGCINFSYVGEEGFAPTEAVELLGKDIAVPAGYQVIGKAEASGGYNEVTREALLQKLETEAKAKGAEAMIITGEAVIPKSYTNRVDREDENMIFPNSSATGTGWAQIESDYNGGDGSAFASNTAATETYMRIVKALYLRKNVQ